MSRALIFDSDNRNPREFNAIFNRGWGLSGSISLQGGLQTTIEIPASVVSQDCFRLGRMILVSDSKLPNWSGMIDPPWKAILPVVANVYSPEYLADLRTPDHKVVLTGSFETVLGKMIAIMNDLEDLHVRLGTMGSLPVGSQQLTVEQKPLWPQINDFGKREGVEYYFRPVYEGNNPLTIYIDASDHIGIETGILLHDGMGANMQVTSADVIGAIVNRVIGIGRQDSKQNRPQTQAYISEASKDVYGLRSAVVQFQNLTTIANLQTATQNSLNNSKQPRLKLGLSLRDRDLFGFLRPGNWYMIHAANIYLPGGVKGWRGAMRMTQMALDDKTRTIFTSMEAWL